MHNHNVDIKQERVDKHVSYVGVWTRTLVISNKNKRPGDVKQESVDKITGDVERLSRHKLTIDVKQGSVDTPISDVKRLRRHKHTSDVKQGSVDTLTVTSSD